MVRASRARMATLSGFLLLCIVCGMLLVRKIWRRQHLHSGGVLPSQQDSSAIKGCVIPEVTIYPDFYQNANWSTPELPNCGYEISLSSILDNKELILRSRFRNVTCCTQDILGADRTNEWYRLSACKEFKGRINIQQRESLFLKCGNHINLVSNIPTKEKIKKKLSHWNQIPLKKRPASVLLLGIDSVSRAHAFRSLPKSIAYMRKLNFTDFKNYHSVAPSTLTNFLAFLMGETRSHVRSGCAPDWTSTFDNCSLIWKDFSRANYVTAYIEDWGQTFSWGGQHGFEENPTDYYLHLPFLALRDLRLSTENTLRNETYRELPPDRRQTYDTLNLDCASNETVSDHIFDYILRFSKKFQGVPYFTFAWINNPYHEVNNALPHLDSKLLTFLKALFQQPQTPERLLFILLSDHGDRTSFFHTSDVESFFERGLPPLFIRPPEFWTRKYPLKVESLWQNRDVLVTPFDLHRSLLNVVSLATNTDDNNYQQQSSFLSRSSSLFDDVPRNRTCEDTNIPKTFCLCNTEIGARADDGINLIEPRLSLMLMTKAIEYLNARIQTHKHLCATWRADGGRDFLYQKLISITGNNLDLILAFRAQPGEAKFESRIQLRVDLGKSAGITGTVIIGTSAVRSVTVLGLSRINKYGDQSLCVKAKTDADKELKEICMCKSYISGVSSH